LKKRKDSSVIIFYVESDNDKKVFYEYFLR